MKSLNVAILGCGTVGGGTARILRDMQSTLQERASRPVTLKKIVEKYPAQAIERFNLPADLFYGSEHELSSEETNDGVEDVLNDPEIDLVIETIGGSNDFIEDLALKICRSGKHLVTANKALLAERGQAIYEAAEANEVVIGFEAAVCGAIPIIKTINESFTGDEIMSISGIMNGTSNYILSRMQNEGLNFDKALKYAQENGYAEADPGLDINGGDAGHKLNILVKLAFGMNISMDQLAIQGIEDITQEEIDFAAEIDSKIKMICFARKEEDKIYATVQPMMVKTNNMLADINGATNAVRVDNKYSGEHVLIGSGAGSSETASAIVGDVVHIARYAGNISKKYPVSDYKLVDPQKVELPYLIIFDTEDVPGITGIVTTSIGQQDINIDTVSHNRHDRDRAVFSIATMPCSREQITAAIHEIQQQYPNILLNQPRVVPILY